MGFISDISGIGKDLFGSKDSSKDTESLFGTTDITKNTSLVSRNLGIDTEQLKLDPAAIQQIIQDVLSGPQGLASIFGGEQSSGLYNSSVSAQAAGDLAAKLVGELAKITGKNVKTDFDAGTEDKEEISSEVRDQKSRSETKNREDGLLSGLF